MAFAPVFRQAFPATFDRHQPAVAAAGWWPVAGKTCVAAYQPVGAASLAASYVNLANPGTNDAAPGTAPTFSAVTGWGWDGATQWLDTGITGGNSFSVLVRFSDGGQKNAAIMGETLTVGNATRLNIYPYYPGPRAYFRGGGNYDQATVYTAGVLAVTPAAAYADGAYLGDVTGNWTGTTTYTITIGGHRINSTVAEFWGGNIQAVAIYSDTLTAGEIATVSAAMAAL